MFTTIRSNNEGERRDKSSLSKVCFLTRKDKGREIVNLVLLGLLTDRNDAFPNPFHKRQLVKPLPFVIPEA